jgi:hypothetical protein
VGIERGPAFLRTLKGRRGWFARVVRGGAVHLETPVKVTSPSPPLTGAPLPPPPIARGSGPGSGPVASSPKPS